jgi:hypothetical protein
MKKTLGVLFVLLCFVIAGFLGAPYINIGGERQASAFMLGGGNHVPPTLLTQFQLFTDTQGIFILREDSEFSNDDDVFSASVSLTEHSGTCVHPTSQLRPFGGDNRLNPLFRDWRYEAVLADSRGVWQKTERLQLRVNITRTGVTYWLPRSAPAGRYGIRVTAYTNEIIRELDSNGHWTGRFIETGERVPAYAWRPNPNDLHGQPNPAAGQVNPVAGMINPMTGEEEPQTIPSTFGQHSAHVVSSVFVVQYSEELNRIECADIKTGSSSYTVTRESRKIDVGVFVNPGAVRTSELVTESAGNFEVGNLDPDLNIDESMLLVSNLSLQWTIENALGQELRPGAIRPLIEAIDGRLSITIPTDAFGNNNLPRGNYVIRVFHDINEGVSGVFIIENGGRYVTPSPNNGAIIMLIFGIVLALGFAGMFVTPKVVARMQQGQYDASERQRYKKQMGLGELTADYAGSTKRVMDPKELEKLTDAEKQELFKRRAAEAKESKGSRYLNKMAENRAKREFAREAGLTMEEFKNLEEKARSMENSKEASLAAFRKAMEDSTGVVTKQQEQEIEEASRIQEERPKRAEGEPEFDLLDSERGREVPDEYKEKPKTAEGDHWKSALKQEQQKDAPKTGYGGFEEEIARLERMEQSGSFEEPAPAPETQCWKQTIVELEAGDGGVQSTTGGIGGSGHFVDIEKPEIKPEESQTTPVAPQATQVETEPAPWLTPETSTVQEEAPEVVAEPVPEPAPEPAPEAKKEEGGGSILSRLRKLTGEDE